MWPFKKKPEKMKDSEIQERYMKAGAIFGDAVSYIYMGECVGFSDMLDEWAKWEKEYARRGFMTFSIDAFIKLGGYNVPLQGLGNKRAEGEEPILHAERYRQEYLGKIKPAVDMNALLKGEAQVGTYVRPSTEESPAETYREEKK